MATPKQLVELRVISDVFNLSMEEVCIEVLKLIDRKFPLPKRRASRN